jgi:Domain of unknown function (DUF4157)
MKCPSISAARTTKSFVPSSRMMLQRKCACGQHTPGGVECAGCREKKSKLQRAGVGSTRAPLAPPIVHEVLRSSGQPLDRQTRAFMEPRFGHDFSRVQPSGRNELTIGAPGDSYEREADQVADRVLTQSSPSARQAADFRDVRVHTDEKAAASARSVNALAYTVGANIVFASGQHQPETSTGRRLIAHELTHVLQQQGAGGGPVVVQRDDDNKSPDPDIPESTQPKEKPGGPTDVGDKSVTCGFDFGNFFKCCVDIGTGDPFCVSGSSIAEARDKLRRGSRSICAPYAGFKAAGTDEFAGQCCKNNKEDSTNCCPPNRISYKESFHRCCPDDQDVKDGVCTKRMESGQPSLPPPDPLPKQDLPGSTLPAGEMYA